MGEGTDPTTVPIEELNKLQSDYDDLTKKYDALKTEHEQLKETHSTLEEEHKSLEKDHEEAKGKLAVIEKAEKDQVIKGILERVKEKAWDQKELEEMDLERLKLILKAVDSTKAAATYKGVRPSASTKDGEGKLTVGDLFHRPYENPSAAGGAE